MECVERNGSHHRIAHGVLLIEVSTHTAWLFIPPSAPFIHEQLHVVTWVILIHDGNVFLEYLFNTHTTLGNRPIILILIEVCSTSLRAIPSVAGVVVKRKTIHAVTNLLHCHFRPVVVVVARTRSNLVKTVAIEFTAISAIATIKVGIVFDTHIATATPAFVTNTDILHLPRFFASILLTKFRHWAILGCHVFHPLSRFLRTTATHIHADVWFTAQHFAEVQELVCTERIVFHRTTPVIIHHARTIFLWTNPIHPVVFISEAATRPTHHRNLDVLQSLKHIITIAIGVWNRRLRTDPKSTIDTSTKVLSKLAIDFFVNLILCLSRIQ